MSYRHIIACTVCAGALLVSCCQDASFDSVRAVFSNPSSSSGVNCWWWWLNGNVTEEAITADLEAMKEKGFQGAVLLDAGGHNQRGNRDIPAGPQFGSPEWIKLFVFALDEAERLGLEIGFNIQSGWNLGGPVVKPENAAKYLTHSEKRIAGGGEINVLLEQPEAREGFYKDIAVIAFPAAACLPSEPVHYLEHKLSIHELGGSAPDCRFLLGNDVVWKNDRDSASVIQRKDIIDLSEFMGPDGTLEWNAPAGEWVVLRFGYTCTGAVVSTSSDTWQGLVLDYLKTEAIDGYLAEVIDPVLEASGHHVGKTLKFMETDSWECGGMNWTDRFREDFREMNGYDLLDYLPVEAGYVVDDMKATHAFMADFRKTVAYDVAHNHYARFGEYAHAHGMGILPESAGPHAGPFDGVRNYSFSDIVMGEFWAPSPHRPRDCDRFFLKQASSAAHIYGKKIVGAESFTTIGPHWNDEIWHSQKPAFDHEICAGLNRVYFHTFTCSPKEMGLPGQEYFAGTHINPRLTWWNEASGFIDYMHRVQSIVQEGRFCGDVLYYYGDHIPVVYPFKHSNMAGCMPGFDYDVVSEDALLRLDVDSDGRIVAPSGLRYRVLVLPDHKVLSMAALEKVGWLVGAGAVVLGDKPVGAVSLVGGEEAPARFAEMADRVWGEGTGDGDGTGAGTGQSGRGVVQYGKGSVVFGMNAREYLLSTGLAPDFGVEEDPEMNGFDFIHYTIDGRDVYFISSFSDEQRIVNCRFRVSGRVPELWNAMDGTIRELETYSSDGVVTVIPLRFEPCGAAIVVFDKAVSMDAANSEIDAAADEEVMDVSQGRNWDDYLPCKTIEGPWSVSFDTAWGGPEKVTFPELSDWTLSSDEGIKYYSGPAVYSVSFDFCPLDEGGRYFIELGSVKDVGMASVRLNGLDVGLTWTNPFRVEITNALCSENNELEVTVVNSWFNRVAGDMLHPEGHQYTSTNINLAVDFRGRPTETVTLSPSGLLGPVRVCELH